MRRFITRFRIPLLVAAAFVILLLIALSVVLSAWFQTWAARRVLAGRSDLRGTIGEVSAGFNAVELRDLRLERDGAVLTVPSARIELPVLSAVVSDDVRVSRLVARGWTVDLSKWQSAAPGATASTPNGGPVSGANSNRGAAPSASGPAAQAAPASQSGATPPGSSGASSAARAGFTGVLQQVQFPFDVAVDGVELAGDVVLPEGRGRVAMSLAGGGLAVGKAGRFTFRSDAALSAEKVKAAGLKGTLVAEMDTPRTLKRVTVAADATASGTQFPAGITLSAEAAATRAATGETYSVGMISEGREVLAINAELPRNGPLLTGTWKTNLRHADLAPFAMGRPLPEFTLVGEGRFDTDPTFEAVHAAGRASGTASELQVLLPQLSELGPLNLAADFDVGRQGDAISIRKLEADLANHGPVARLQALQAFEFNPSTAELKAENAERDLFDLALHGVPAAWIRPFAPGFAIAGGDVRGELVALMRAGGTTLRTKSPLTVSGVSVAQEGKPLVEDVAVSLAASTDYTPHGWQAEIGDLSIRRGPATIVALSAKAGQLPGENQPVKATGKVTADLAAVLAQPVAAGALTLTRGEAALDFAASLGATKELQAKVALAKLAVPAQPKPDAAGSAKPAAPTEEALPTVTADLRADLAPDGQLTFNAPIVLERNARKSDLTIAGTMKTEKEVRTIEAQVGSENLIVDDATIMAALMPPPAEPEEADRTAKPFWSGLRGTLGLRLKKVIYSDSFQVSDVAGTLRLDERRLTVEGLRMGMGEGDARLDGSLSFQPGEPEPYELNAAVAMRDVDPGPLLRALNPGQPATLEGKFTLKSELNARADSWENLPPALMGDFEVTSRGGVFRGLPVSVGNLVENSGKVAGWLASAGSALGVLTGRKDDMDVTSKVQAVAEFVKGLNPIPFDQLSMRLSRDAARNTAMEDFALISPEIRLTGHGRMTHRSGGQVLDDALSMEFKLRARGRQGDLLKYLGVLEPQPDQLGYSGCTVPFNVRGTLGNPDTTELNQRLVAIALEKTGVGDKAAELLQKFRGNKPSGGE